MPSLIPSNNIGGISEFCRTTLRHWSNISRMPVPCQEALRDPHAQDKRCINVGRTPQDLFFEMLPG